MPIYRVQAPDGSVVRIEGPDGASEADLISAARQHKEPAYTPAQDMTNTEKFWAGMGAGMSDLYLGAKQRLGLANEQDVEAKRAMDAPLVGAGSGKLGSFVGQAVPALATVPIPGANTLAGAAITGGALGALQPTGQGEYTAGNIAGGAVGGLAGQFGANVVGKVIAPFRSSLNPESARLAQVLQSSGVPLDLAQRTGSKPLRIINSVLDNLPLTSGREEAKREIQAQAFNRAVLAKTGTAADSATPDVINGAFNRIGSNFNNIYGRNAVKLDEPLVQDMSAALQGADFAEPLTRKFDKIFGQGPDIPGQKYQDIRTQLRNLQGSADPEVRRGAKEMKAALDEAAARSISPNDAELLAQTRQEYANLKPVAESMKATSGLSGNVPPLQLRAAVANQPAGGYARGMGDLNDLARAGASFLPDRTPNSGSAQRWGYQALLTGGLGAGGGVGSLLTGGNPADAAQNAGAGLAMGLLGPMTVQRALGNKLVASYLNSSAGRALLADEARRLLSPGLLGAGALAYPRPQ